RSGVKAGVCAARRIVPVRQIPGAEESGDPCHVGLKCQSGQVILQLDVLVERLRNSDGNGYGRHISGCLPCNFEPALDFADVFGVLLETRAIAGPDGRSNTSEAFCNDIQNASLLASSSGAFFRIAAIAKEPLEYRLRVEFHWLRLVGRRPRNRVCIRAAVS